MGTSEEKYFAKLLLPGCRIRHRIMANRCEVYGITATCKRCMPQKQEAEHHYQGDIPAADSSSKEAEIALGRGLLLPLGSSSIS